MEPTKLRWMFMKRYKIFCIFSALMFLSIITELLWIYTTHTSLPKRVQQNSQDDSYVLGRSVKHWVEPASIPITRRSFVASEEGRVFILGAVAQNSTPSAKWDKYAIYGQWYDHNRVKVSQLRCCFKYANGTVATHGVANFNVRDFNPLMYTAKLLVWHLTCEIPIVDPQWISVSRTSSCDSVTFIKPHYAMAQPNDHLVITTKVAHSYIDPTRVISFLETVKYFGADKIIIYVHKTLDPRVKKVLRFFTHTGLVEYNDIELANEIETPRYFNAVNAQYMSDDWLIKWDALERSKGATYFGIFDMDDFLLPSRDRSYKELLAELLMSYPNASQFFFRNVNFLTDSRQTDTNCEPDCSIFRRHIMTSPWRFNNIDEKMLILPARVVTKSLHRHGVASLPGYVRATCPTQEAFVRHYGKCQKKFLSTICRDGRRWVKDSTMVEWSERSVQGQITSTMNFLNIVSNLAP